MRIFFSVIILIILINNSFASSNSQTPDNRKFYEGREKFMREYIADIKEKRKIDKEFKGSVVETLWGKIYTRLGTESQQELDEAAIKDCKSDGGVDCLVRFRSLKKNPNYNRFAVYNDNNKTLKVLDELIYSKKVYSAKGIDILINQKNFRNKNDFNCKKSTSNYREILNILRKEIEIYPLNFLKRSGLKYVMICEDIIDRGIVPAGLAPSHFDKSPGVFYVNINEINKHKKNKTNIIKHVFHHEFYHVIDATLAKLYIDDKWNKLNKQNYSSELVIDSNVIDNSVKGYISKYARNSIAEDKAELFAFMVTQHKKFKSVLKNDPVLFEKSKLMISRLKFLSKDMNKKFWRKLN